MINMNRSHPLDRRSWRAAAALCVLAVGLLAAATAGATCRRVTQSDHFYYECDDSGQLRRVTQIARPALGDDIYHFAEIGGYATWAYVSGIAGTARFYSRVKSAAMPYRSVSQTRYLSRGDAIQEYRNTGGLASWSYYDGLQRQAAFYSRPVTGEGTAVRLTHVGRNGYGDFLASAPGAYARGRMVWYYYDGLSRQYAYYYRCHDGSTAQERITQLARQDWGDQITGFSVTGDQATWTFRSGSGGAPTQHSATLSDACPRPAAPTLCTGVTCDDGEVCSWDTCEVTTGTCVHQPASGGAVCRPAAGPCDVPETCDGTSTSCPFDDKKTSVFVCRPAAGPCDRVETCTGTSNACPADLLKPAGTGCMRSCTGGICPAMRGVCDGQSVACHAPDWATR